MVGTLWRSNKQIKAPYVFDGEYGIALNAMQGNQDSFRGKGEVSCIYLSCGGNLGCILELRRVAIENSCLFSDIRTPV